MSRYPFRRVGNALVPASREAAEELRGVADGKHLMVTLKAPRNIRQFNLFWALCEIVAEHSEIYDTKEKAKKGLLFATGHVDTWMDVDGRLHLDPKSIAFESMTQSEFATFFEAAVRVVCQWLGTAPADVRNRAGEMIDGRRAA